MHGSRVHEMLASTCTGITNCC